MPDATRAPSAPTAVRLAPAQAAALRGLARPLATSPEVVVARLLARVPPDGGDLAVDVDAAERAALLAVVARVEGDGAALDDPALAALRDLARAAAVRL
jgi:murein tripeptide amidase MpaA